MADTSHGTGGLTFDKSKRSWPIHRMNFNHLSDITQSRISIILFLTSVRFRIP